LAEQGSDLVCDDLLIRSEIFGTSRQQQFSRYQNARCRLSAYCLPSFLRRLFRYLRRWRRGCLQT
jgi:hypothetical protein